MDHQTVNEMLDQLKNGERKEFTVSNDLFLTVREVLVKREDFKHFRGIARHEGHTVYRYMETARS
ncbi:hypothetical protein CEF21_09830 [Bacillus sp. FJAT-42376]|uniref:hypothetical protein n=1 Tax=Bacillus sp. FJAT-42376 TaxID=2014076 RepID=UPI000F4FED2F|nr:hypothetical protein [Bacillus sp. FJAT-42376]AZB42562.1 hypothetical protein CEF21_09830 [Bacillus sp. FJAT-42376]